MKPTLILILISLILPLSASAEYLATGGGTARDTIFPTDKLLESHSIDGIVYIEADVETTKRVKPIEVYGKGLIYVTGTVAEHIWKRAIHSGVDAAEGNRGRLELSFGGWNCNKQENSSLYEQLDLLLINTSDEYDGLYRCAKPLFGI